jgi:mRNA (guanine-N7-)-methyltransferase
VNFHRKIEKAQKKSKRMSGFPIPRTESTHHRLYEFAKSAIIKIFAHPYATVSNTNPSLSPHTHTHICLIWIFCFLVLHVKVCDLYCGGGVDIEKWDAAQITHYIGIGLFFFFLSYTD